MNTLRNIDDMPKEWRSFLSANNGQDFAPKRCPDLDEVAYWFDRRVARNATLRPLKAYGRGFQLAFEVLCFVGGKPTWRQWESSPLPVMSFQDAKELARRLGIL